MGKTIDPRRVLERFILSSEHERKAMSDEESKDLEALVKILEKYTNHLAKDEQAIKDDPRDYIVQINAGASVRAVFSFLKRAGIELLFYGLLKNFNMSAKDRKIIEKASKTFSKSQINKIKAFKAVQAYTNFLSDLRLFLSTAQSILKSGQLHKSEESNTVFKAGPFNLINSGGFPDKQMDEVVKVVEKAYKSLSRIGLSKICYGDIQITNSIGRSSRVLAFYVINKDELYVRANLKGKQVSAVHAVTHELAHRLHFKFLKGKNRQIENIYEILQDRDRQALWDLSQDPSKAPKPGETFQDGRKTWVVVDGPRVNRQGKPGVSIELQNKPGTRAFMRLTEWFKGNTGGMGFISMYASKDYKENFAEMVANYALGTLPDDQVNLLKTVL